MTLIASVTVTSTDSAEKSKTLQSDQTVQITTQVQAQKTEVTLGSKADALH